MVDIAKECKKVVDMNYEARSPEEFKNWLELRAGSAFQKIYRRQYEHPEINVKELRTVLTFLSMNIVFAIQSYITMEGNVRREALGEFIEEFVGHQSKDLSIWCHILQDSF